MRYIRHAALILTIIFTGGSMFKRNMPHASYLIALSLLASSSVYAISAKESVQLYPDCGSSSIRNNIIQTYPVALAYPRNCPNPSAIPADIGALVWI
jgi:hypothetical protein